MDTKQIRNTLLLALTALVWGSAFVAQSVGAEHVGPFTFLASRSYLGGIVPVSYTHLLPFFTGQIPEIGSMLLPMHIPVLLCGMIVGGPWGLLIGFLCPLLRSALFSMPPPYPTAVSMAFELAAYRCV